MIIAPKPDNAPQMSRVTVMQGMVEVSSDTHTILTTVLGSCVAACLFDPVARVGGMNHFLLAEPHAANAGATADTHYGIYLMELLINRMLAKGASKSRMRAHIYGGANIHQNMQRIGSLNVELAERFLTAERLQVSHRDTGGQGARRVDFLAALGKARCRKVEAVVSTTPVATAAKSVGDVEFF